MKILFINHEYPPIGGGAATVTRELLDRLHTLGHKIILLTEQVPKDKLIYNEPQFSVFRINAKRESVYHGSYLEFILFFIKAIFILSHIHKSFNPDIAFAFFTIPGGLVALVQKLLFRVPYIISIRGGDIPGFEVDRKLSFFQWLFRPLIRLICLQADKIHVNSLRLKSLTEKLVPKKEVTLIPNGINFPEIFNNNVDNQQKMKLLFVGRLSKQKNLHIFLRAFGLFMKDKGPDISFTIIGEGPERKSLELLVNSLKLKDIVVFKDWIDRNMLSKEYQSHTITVLPSIDEGMPNVALESIANGCPVLGSASGSLPWKDEKLQQKWVVENEMEVNLWVKHLKKINENRETIPGDANTMYQFVSENYSYDSLIPLYEELLRKSVVKRKQINKNRRNKNV